MTGSGTGAGTGACSSRSGVLNLTQGLRRDPPLVRTIADVRKEHRGRAGQCTLSNWTRARLLVRQGTGNRVTARHREAAAVAQEARARARVLQVRDRARHG